MERYVCGMCMLLQVTDWLAYNTVEALRISNDKKDPST